MKRLMMMGLFASTAFGQLDPGIVREGVGDRRDALTAMELEPFPGDAWTALSEWSGEALSPTLVRDKVVVFVTWKSWYPASTRVLPGVQRLLEKHPDDLVVVGVHDPKGYENASKIVERYGLSFPTALDADGKFREIMHTDQDPDLYLVDRAGQLRYADIETGALDRAVEKLVAESTDAAGGINARLAEDAAKRDTEFRRAVDINQDVALMDLPVVPFEAPGPEAYQRVSWPSLPTNDRNRGGRYGNNDGPIGLGLPTEDSPAWASTTAPLMDGRARVVYFWNPFHGDTYHKVMPMMDLVQKRHGRDVAVVGVLTPDDPNDRNMSEAERARRTDPTRLQAMAREFKRNQKLRHSLFYDGSGALIQSINNNRNSRGSFPMLAAVVSSDGIARWYGSPFDDGFKAALDRVLKVDPGVRARRAAEEAYLRTRK